MHHTVVLRWDRIIASPTPRLAPRQPLQSEPASANNAMRLNCFQKIRRTAWRESTAQAGSAEQVEERRQCELVKPNEKAKQSEHQSARIEVRFARRNHSSSNAR